MTDINDWKPSIGCNSETGSQAEADLRSCRFGLAFLSREHRKQSRMPTIEDYRLAYRDQFRSHYREDFQAWFEKLARSIYSVGDFQRIRHSSGDGGLDCYVISSLLVYQVYAPARIVELGDAKTATKIKRDFNLAFKTLDGRFKHWVFVHNHPEAKIGHRTTAAISKLSEEYPMVKLSVLDIDTLWELLERQPERVLNNFFGRAPSLSTAGADDNRALQGQPQPGGRLAAIRSQLLDDVDGCCVICREPRTSVRLFKVSDGWFRGYQNYVPLCSDCRERTLRADIHQSQLEALRDRLIEDCNLGKTREVIDAYINEELKTLWSDTIRASNYDEIVRLRLRCQEVLYRWNPLSVDAGQLLITLQHLERKLLPPDDSDCHSPIHLRPGWGLAPFWCILCLSCGLVIFPYVGFGVALTLGVVTFAVLTLLGIIAERPFFCLAITIALPICLTEETLHLIAARWPFALCRDAYGRKTPFYRYFNALELNGKQIEGGLIGIFRQAFQDRRYNLSVNKSRLLREARDDIPSQIVTESISRNKA